MQTIRRQVIEKTLLWHEIPIHLWGQGGAKSLMKEVEQGETELVVIDGKLTRQISVVNLDVYYYSPICNCCVWKLKENKQVFKDGRTRVRERESSIAEKMKPGEDLDAAAQRALKEEIGISGEGLEFKRQEDMDETEDKESPSYPGLSTVYKLYWYSIVLPKKYYKPEGYETDDGEVHLYFSWVKIR